jgi:aminoacyl tRNA synthase complex-interacting multifunctional protein 1
MSSQAAISKLPSPLKELVLSAVQDDVQAFGTTEKDKAEVMEWIEKVAAGDVGKPETLQVYDFCMKLCMPAHCVP